MGRTKKTAKTKAPSRSSRVTRSAAAPKASASTTRTSPRGRRKVSRKSTTTLANNARPSISAEVPSPSIEPSTSSPVLTQDDIPRIVDAVLRGMPNPPAALATTTAGEEFDVATTSLEDQPPG